MTARGQRPCLVLDLGNTRLKWALVSAGRFVEEPQAQRADPLSLPWASWRRAAPAAICLASVAPGVTTERIIDAATASLGISVDRVAVQAEWHGLKCAYRHPERFGVDRWLGLIAAHHEDPTRAALVVSAGTALTLDHLDPNGRHRGGLIAPGLAAMRAGLFSAAPGLLRFDGGAAGPGMATDSADAIASGCLQAALGLIERSRQVMHNASDAPRVLVSGGDGAALVAHLGPHAAWRPWLVLEGLALWADTQRGAGPRPAGASGID